MRAEVDLARDAIGNDGRGARRVVEQRVGHAVGQVPGEGGIGEDRPHVCVAQLMSNLEWRRERVDEDGAAPFRCRERDEELRRCRKQDRRAFSRQRTHQRGAPLQKREAGGHELLALDVVDASAVGGDGKRQEREWVGHTPRN